MRPEYKVPYFWNVAEFLSNVAIRELTNKTAELDAPFPESPNEGRLEFFVDCSANATPEFEGRGGDELAAEISRTLTRAYRDPQVFDLKSLCLLPGRQVRRN